MAINTKEYTEYKAPFIGQLSTQEFNLWERFFEKKDGVRNSFNGGGLHIVKWEYRDYIQSSLRRDVNEKLLNGMLHGLDADLEHYLGKQNLFNLRSVEMDRQLPKTTAVALHRLQRVFNRVMGVNFLDYSREASKSSLLLSYRIYSALPRTSEAQDAQLELTDLGFTLGKKSVIYTLPNRLAVLDNPDDDADFSITAGYDFAAAVSSFERGGDKIKAIKETFADVRSLSLIKAAIGRIQKGNKAYITPPTTGIDLPLKIVIGSDFPASQTTKFEPYDEVLAMRLKSVRKGTLFTLKFLTGEFPPHDWKSKLTSVK